MLINGVELKDIDIFDLEASEVIENAIEKVNKVCESKQPSKMSESIRLQCTAVFDCFNEIFGEGTDKKVFGNKVNLMDCLRAFGDLVENMAKQREDAEKEVNNLTSKYSSNRAQRRSKNNRK